MAGVAALRDVFEDHPDAGSTGVAFAALGMYLAWIEVYLTAAGAALSGTAPAAVADVVPAAVDSGLAAVAATSLRNAAVLVVGIAAFAWALERIRPLTDPVERPDRSAAAVAVVGVVGVVVPAGPVVVAGAIALATGGTLDPIADVVPRRGSDLVQPLVVTGLGVATTLPGYLAVTHVVFQRTLGLARRTSLAVVVPVIVVGLGGPHGFLSVRLSRALAAVVLVLLAIALPVVADETFDEPWLVRLSAVPLAVLAAAAVVSPIAGLGGSVEALHAGAGLLAVLVGTVAYQRTGSLVPSALAYASYVFAPEVAALLLR